MFFKIFFSVTLVAASYCQCSAQPNSLNFLSATTGAACYEVCYDNNLVFAGNGNTLAVYDAGPGSTPPYTEHILYRFQSNIANIQIYNGSLFVAANHDGIAKFDITNPYNPQLLWQKVPDTLTEAAYDLAFKGDTIFVAYRSKVAAFRDNGISYSLIQYFAQRILGDHVKGVDVKGNLLAFATAYSAFNFADGVYLFDATTLTQLSYTKQTYCDAEDVLFGKNTSLLHVMGGTQSTQFPLDLSGLFYSLNVSIPSMPVEVFRDTIPGYLLFLASISQPMSAVNINDTIYVATQGSVGIGWSLPNPFWSDVYVYDATSSSTVNFITGVYGGLYHFDLDIHNGTMYVASEWYGLLATDISNLFADQQIGKTLTGGWCITSDVYNNRLIQANEGYGMRLYDITDPQNPALLDTNLAPGFCFHARYSQNGDYIYANYLTGDGFRVYDSASLSQVGSIAAYKGYEHGCVWQNIYINYQQPFFGGGFKGINRTNVSNPALPFVSDSVALEANDIVMDGSGKIIVSTNDSLVVYDITTGISWKSSVYNTGSQNFTKAAIYYDSVFVFVKNLGLVHFQFNSVSGVLTPFDTTVLPLSDVKAMAADSFSLYICFQQEGLYAYDKKTMAQTGYYKTGLEFTPSFLWGPQDLTCKNNLVFLAEYFGQTTILSGDPSNPFGFDEMIAETNSCIRIFPNPVSESTLLMIDFTQCSLQPVHVSVADITGRAISATWSKSRNQIILNTTKLKAGIYYCLISDLSGRKSAVKFIVK